MMHIEGTHDEYRKALESAVAGRRVRVVATGRVDLEDGHSPTDIVADITMKSGRSIQVHFDPTAYHQVLLSTVDPEDRGRGWPESQPSFMTIEDFAAGLDRIDRDDTTPERHG